MLFFEQKEELVVEEVSLEEALIGLVESNEAMLELNEALFVAACTIDNSLEEAEGDKEAKKESFLKRALIMLKERGKALFEKLIKAFYAIRTQVTKVIAKMSGQATYTAPEGTLKLMDLSQVYLTGGMMAINGIFKGLSTVTKAGFNNQVGNTDNIEDKVDGFVKNIDLFALKFMGKMKKEMDDAKEKINLKKYSEAISKNKVTDLQSRADGALREINAIKREIEQISGYQNLRWTQTAMVKAGAFFTYYLSCVRNILAHLRKPSGVVEDEN